MLVLDQAEMASLLSKVHSLLLLTLVWPNCDFILGRSRSARSFRHFCCRCVSNECVVRYVSSENKGLRGYQCEEGRVLKVGRPSRKVATETVFKQEFYKGVVTRVRARHTVATICCGASCSVDQVQRTEPIYQFAVLSLFILHDKWRLGHFVASAETSSS